jgi:hypothetical protein
MNIADTFRFVRDKLPGNLKDKLHEIRIDAPKDFHRFDAIFGVKRCFFIHEPIYAVSDQENPKIFLFDSKYKNEISDIAQESNIPCVDMPKTNSRFYGIQDVNVSYIVDPFIEFSNRNLYIVKNTL